MPQPLCRARAHLGQRDATHPTRADRVGGAGKAGARAHLLRTRVRAARRTRSVARRAASAERLRRFPGSGRHGRLRRAATTDGSVPDGIRRESLPLVAMPLGNQMRVIGFAGWSGAGKTTLITRLIPLFTGRGLEVAALKHAHHSFEVDRPGKDSYEFRAAGAREVLVVSARRWAQMHELRGETEPTLAALLRRLSPCDLVLIEGFKEQ